MPSASLQQWQNDRMPRLAEMDSHCAATLKLAPPRPLLAEESLRGYVMLLSGHFQGYCRDLYTECSQVLVSNVGAAVRFTVQAQCAAELKINRSNPTVQTIKKDFARFTLLLDFDLDPANGPRLTHLGELNKWRNAIAHQQSNPPRGVPALSVARVQAWLASCNELATWLDAVLYNEWQRILGTAPW